MTDEATELLRKIEAVAISLNYRARWIEEDAGRLVSRPGWETKAEAEMIAAEAALKRALNAVQGARKLYHRKSIAA